ncbi:GH3 family domain-containing protein [Fodinicurvata sediminis]|uniref:GH3 family domain-containing protein n=1 Tax=Fodinicurvata sediminis TaxID=1121832 RepID=UPI0003B3FBEE|nr:GH3 auxin-responsive promoter family protein [Fodinicurvata sediminis]
MMDATPILRLYARWRQKRLARLDPVKSQEQILLKLLQEARDTRFGRDHGFADITTVEAFQERVPLRRYEDFWQVYWRDAFPRLDNITWPGLVPWFAVTSGTTTGKTKYIPVTDRMLASNRKAALDIITWHLQAHPDSRLFAGKSFMLGGSTALVEEAPGVYSGDISGIITGAMPWWGKVFAFPDKDLALLSDWEEKLERTAEASLIQDIRSLSGTPSWLLILLERARELNGGQTPYPNLELLVHGGVNFEPYRARFERLLSDTPASFREVYPASEAFIAGADAGPHDGLRLNLDHDVFYEFVPLDELDHECPTRHWIDTVETGVNYAIAVTSCAGAWAYLIGDTVRFSNLQPPRIFVTGRTSYSLSAFGEHLIAEEVENAVAEAARSAGLEVTDYSMGAVFPEADRHRGHHRLYIEFDQVPDSEQTSRFAAEVDRLLAEENDDYAAHRGGGAGMGAPEVQAMPPGTFAAWMKKRGRLGGQNKVPRLISDPDLFADLQEFCRAR